MRSFFRELWYGEPVRVFGLLSTVGVAYVGFGSPPTWAKLAVVVVNAVAGFYGFRSLTTPAFPESAGRTGEFHHGAGADAGEELLEGSPEIPGH